MTRAETEELIDQFLNYLYSRGMRAAVFAQGEWVSLDIHDLVPYRETFLDSLEEPV